MISFESTGSFTKTDRFLASMSKFNISSILRSAGRKGVDALARATPLETGLAASSWGYLVEQTSKSVTITWTNSDNENGFPVAIVLQYGYATGTGGYVQGRDYINPAIKPIFDEILNTVWKAVTSA